MCFTGVFHSRCSFETLSAIGTVGLTKGITPELPFLFKTGNNIVDVCRSFGELDGIMAIVERSTAKQIRNPVEKIIVG